MTSTYNLLHLDASARTRSFSRRLSAAYADAWRARHPDGDYRYRDLAVAGHFAVDDVTFVHAELTNALVDPRLADRRTDHEASLAAALTAVTA